MDCRCFVLAVLKTAKTIVLCNTTSYQAQKRCYGWWHPGRECVMSPYMYDAPFMMSPFRLWDNLWKLCQKLVKTKKRSPPKLQCVFGPKVSEDQKKKKGPRWRFSGISLRMWMETQCWGYSDVRRIVGALKTFPFTKCTVFRKRVLTAIT